MLRITKLIILKLPRLDAVTVIRNPTSDNEISTIKYDVDELKKTTILRFNQTLQNYLKVSVGNHVYNPPKYDRRQTSIISIIKFPNSGGYFFQQRIIKCIEDCWEKQNFIKPTRTDNPVTNKRAKSSPTFADSFICLETNGNKFGPNVCVRFGRTAMKQTTNITFYVNRFSVCTSNRGSIE